MAEPLREPECSSNKGTPPDTRSGLPTASSILRTSSMCFYNGPTSASAAGQGRTQQAPCFRV